MGKIYKNSILYGGGGGGSAGHTIQDTDGTDMPAEDNLQFVGLDVQDDSTNDATTVEAFGLNSDSLDDVVDGSIGNEIINNGMTYSTNEQVVGKWIDGKPIYQKTFQIASVTDGMEITRGVETLVYYEAISERTDGGQLVNFCVDSSSKTFQNGLYCFLYNNTVNLYSRGSIAATSCALTLRYTKVSS